jgi:hypothetical protein
VCTHPAVLKAAARLFSPVTGRSGRVSYGDSSAGGRPRDNLEACGIAAAARELGLEAADFEQGRSVAFPASPHHKSFQLAAGALAADGIINLCKLKTHTLTRMTGAVKNLYGCIPGKLKTALHVVYPVPREFCRMLVALNLYCSPRAAARHGRDVAMEGNGPRGGNTPPGRASSTDPRADAVMCRLVELNPPTCPPPGRDGPGAQIPGRGDRAGRGARGAPAHGDFRVRSEPGLSQAGMMSHQQRHRQAPVIILAHALRAACRPSGPAQADWHDGTASARPTSTCAASAATAVRRSARRGPSPQWSMLAL